jgi:hypothetical protein
VVDAATLHQGHVNDAIEASGDNGRAAATAVPLPRYSCIGGKWVGSGRNETDGRDTAIQRASARPQRQSRRKCRRLCCMVSSVTGLLREPSIRLAPPKVE